MKRIWLACLLLVAITAGNAQTKVYQTKSGKVRFYSSTAVENIEANNTQVDAKLATNGQMVFMVAIRGFVFKNALMQEHFNENYMESDKFPKASFMGTVTNIKEVDFTKDGSYKVTVSGDMEIHGTKQKVSAPGTIEIKGGVVTATSVFKLTITDYGIKGNYIGDKIAREVEITLNCKYD
ncbi:Lipid/polyisoprenoid-binding, YceI-like protein [Russula earlei]|uniref:Lipid/polyisoprenoid-binding, YceI-like protein n=1 Tax=Russula earlei TaxID=71964 RepID=A0ACC0TU47_9AGAM|nr:Lipid/polyisoprenoid-binding, YceI-like protein [Russula earlei]